MTTPQNMEKEILSNRLFYQRGYADGEQAMLEKLNHAINHFIAENGPIDGIYIEKNHINFTRDSKVVPFPTTPTT